MDKIDWTLTDNLTVSRDSIKLERSWREMAWRGLGRKFSDYLQANFFERRSDGTYTYVCIYFAIRETFSTVGCWQVARKKMAKCCSIVSLRLDARSIRDCTRRGISFSPRVGKSVDCNVWKVSGLGESACFSMAECVCTYVRVPIFTAT